MKGTVIVVPAYNEAGTIAAVVTDLCRSRPERVIVVDDGSRDDTAARVEALIRSGECEDTEIELARHPRNLGKGFALANGMARALHLGAERVITFDGDGQHDAGDVPRLEQVNRIHPDAVVIAARAKDRHRAPVLRRFANDTADFWISWACGMRIRDTQSGFRLYPSALLSGLSTRPRENRGFAFETELLIDATSAGVLVRSVPIETRYLEQGRPSHYRPWHDTWSIIRLVAAHLLRRGMYLKGLVRSLNSAPPEAARSQV